MRFILDLNVTVELFYKMFEKTDQFNKLMYNWLVLKKKENPGERQLLNYKNW